VRFALRGSDCFFGVLISQSPLATDYQRLDIYPWDSYCKAHAAVVIDIAETERMTLIEKPKKMYS
jgi:hypothetical protein